MFEPIYRLKTAKKAKSEPFKKGSFTTRTEIVIKQLFLTKGNQVNQLKFNRVKSIKKDPK